MSAKIEAFFHEATNTVCYVVSDPATKHAAIVDSCLDFDMAAARTQTTHADQVLAYIAANDLTVDWILETHVHADHLSAAPYLRDQIGGLFICIGGQQAKTPQHSVGHAHALSIHSQAARRSLSCAS